MDFATSDIKDETPQLPGKIAHCHYFDKKINHVVCPTQKYSLKRGEEVEMRRREMHRDGKSKFRYLIGPPEGEITIRRCF